MNKDEITYYMGLALKEAKKAEKINEVPIGAILIDNKKNIIGKKKGVRQRVNFVDRDSTPKVKIQFSTDLAG